MLLEEIAAGDVDLAMVLGETAVLARAVHEAMNDAQRKRWWPKFESDERFHLALIARDPDAELGWSYHHAVPADADVIGAPGLSAVSTTPAVASAIAVQPMGDGLSPRRISPASAINSGSVFT